jgi:hypothetical protein
VTRTEEQEEDRQLANPGTSPSSLPTVLPWRFSREAPQKPGPILVATFDFSSFAGGSFVTDSAGSPRNKTSLHGMIGVLLFPLSSTVLCSGVVFAKPPNEVHFQGWTLLTITHEDIDTIYP